MTRGPLPRHMYTGEVPYYESGGGTGITLVGMNLLNLRTGNFRSCLLRAGHTIITFHQTSDSVLTCLPRLFDGEGGTAVVVDDVVSDRGEDVTLLFPNVVAEAGFRIPMIFAATDHPFYSQEVLEDAGYDEIVGRIGESGQNIDQLAGAITRTKSLQVSIQPIN
jgi:hypothetical protein